MSAGGAKPAADPEPMMEMNMTPLIDVMLVLIIMMIITIPKANHSVNLNMPTGNPPPPLTPPVVITIDVDFDGTILWDGQVVDRATMENKFKAVAAIPDQPEVHLRPNKLVHYKSVAGVMASAQRLGVKKIGMVGNEQFLD
jgi:biopolymer transport protein ExbD